MKKAKKAAGADREAEAARLKAMDRQDVTDIFAEAERRLDLSRKSGTEKGVALTYGRNK